MRDTISIGDIEYQSIAVLQKTLGMSRKAARVWLKDLRVPVMFVGDGTYFLKSALEEAVFACMQVGEKGLLAPGSKMKKHWPKNTDAYRELPEHLESPESRKKIQQKLKEQRSAARNRRTARLKQAVNNQKPNG